MKVLPLLWGAFGVGVLVVAGTYLVEGDYSRRAQLVQRVQRDETAELFGDPGTPIGSPQLLIIDDPKAIIEGRAEESGARLVDEGYLRKNEIYPLQMKTVSFIAGTVRLGGIALAVLGLGGIALVRRRGG
jgi:hypothetical protein